MPKMTITSNAVVPPKQNAARKQAVEVHAQVDCMLWFDDGFAVGIKKNESCYLAFDDDGYYHFQVEYAIPMTAVEETVSVTEASIGGTTVVTETALMTAKIASGPTGDITVP